MENLVRAHVYVKGQVQGVFYRAFVQEHAQRLGLNGWVKNLADGRVEAVFEGSPESVEQMIEKCKEGPPAAQVSHVDLIWEKATGEFSGFSIAKT